MTYICIWDTKRLKIKDNGLVNRPNSFCDGNIRVSYISIKFTPFECQIFQVSIWYVWTLRDFKFKVPGGGGDFAPTRLFSLSLPNKYNFHFETYTSKKIHQLYIRSSRMTYFCSANIQTEGQFPRLHKTRATGAFIRAGSAVIVAESAARGRQQTKSTFGTLHH